MKLNGLETIMLLSVLYLSSNRIRQLTGKEPATVKANQIYEKLNKFLTITRLNKCNTRVQHPCKKKNKHSITTTSPIIKLTEIINIIFDYVNCSKMAIFGTFWKLRYAKTWCVRSSQMSLYLQCLAMKTMSLLLPIFT